jgi:GAF domain-containing protein
MTVKNRPDPGPFLAAVAAASRQSGQPDASFRALDRALGQAIGHKLFTVLLHHRDTGESERFYSNRPEAYPVGGRKALNPTFWSQHVLRDQKPYIGRTATDIAAVFYDHELIASLGCDSVLNLPVVFDGRTLGTLNLLDAADHYDEADAELGAIFAALAVPAYLKLVGG